MLIFANTLNTSDQYHVAPRVMASLSKESFKDVNTSLSFTSASIAVVQACLQVPWYFYVITLGSILLVWLLVLLAFLHRRPWDKTLCNPLIRRTSRSHYSIKTFISSIYRRPYYETEYISPKFSHKMEHNISHDIDTSLLTIVVEDDPVGYAENSGMLPCIPVEDEINAHELFEKLVEMDSDITRYNFLFIATPSRRLESARSLALNKEIGLALRNYHRKYKADKRVRIISKIDSCLRSNYESEYEGLTDGLGKRECIEVLIPSYVEQGRVTIHGSQYIKENGEYRLMHQSEYASFKGLEYSNSDLALWMERRVDHIGSRKNVGLIDIDVMRTQSAEEIAANILEARQRKVNAFVFDTVEANDLTSAANILSTLEQQEKTLFLKLGPSMINLYAAAYAIPHEKNRLDHIQAGDTGIIIAGSLTSTTKKQIERYDDYPDTSIVTIKESDLTNIHNADDIITKRSNNIIKKNNDGDDVILTTEYWKTDKNEYPDIQKRDTVLSLIAKICERIRVSERRWFLIKGSDTALYTIIHGLKIRHFYYCGQYIPGVIHCKCEFNGALKSFFIVGGNVGTPSLLKKLKEAMTKELSGD